MKKKEYKMPETQVVPILVEKDFLDGSVTASGENMSYDIDEEDW